MIFFLVFFLKIKSRVYENLLELSEKAEQPKPCKGEFCPQIEVADLEGIFLEPPGQIGSYEALADAPQAAQVPEDLSIRLDTDYEWPSRPDSPDIR